jgi:hypothetical protein
MAPELLEDAARRVFVYFVPPALSDEWARCRPPQVPLDSEVQGFNPKDFTPTFWVDGSRQFWWIQLATYQFYRYTGVALVACCLITVWRVGGAPETSMTFGILMGAVTYAMCSSMVAVWTARYEAPMAFLAVVSVVVALTAKAPGSSVAHALRERRRQDT